MQEKFTINKETSELKRNKITQAHLYLVDNNRIDNSEMNLSEITHQIKNIPIEDHVNLVSLWCLWMHSSDFHDFNAVKITQIRLQMAEKQPENPNYVLNASVFTIRSGSVSEAGHVVLSDRYCSNPTIRVRLTNVADRVKLWWIGSGIEAEPELELKSNRDLEWVETWQARRRMARSWCS